MEVAGFVLLTRRPLKGKFVASKEEVSVPAGCLKAVNWPVLPRAWSVPWNATYFCSGCARRTNIRRLHQNLPMFWDPWCPFAFYVADILCSCRKVFTGAYEVKQNQNSAGGCQQTNIRLMEEVKNQVDANQNQESIPYESEAWGSPQHTLHPQDKVASWKWNFSFQR